MDPRTWRKIEALYHAALEREPASRDAFLARNCAGEPDLQQEVESLLARDHTTGLLNQPLWAVANVDAQSSEPPGLEKGTRLNHYVVGELIGAGGMGQVYRARDARLARDVALKILRPESAATVGRQRRFEHEAIAAAALNHPNIVAVYDIGESDGTQYIVSEFVSGSSLHEILRKGPLPPRQAIQIAIAIAAGLQAAHAAGIVHRDLKPANVMVHTEPNGDIVSVKILDFGLARQTIIDEDSDTQTALTRAGELYGTVSYMSPEQARGMPVDARTDLWSLGVVLYEMLTGKRPFSGATTVAVLANIVGPHPVSFDGVRVPRPLKAVLSKALAKDRHRRYQSANDFARDLNQSLDGKSTKSRLGLRTAVASVGLLLAAGGMTLLPWTPWRLTDIASSASNITRHELACSFVIQKMRDGHLVGEPYLSQPQETFEAGWKLRIRFRSPEPGHVYVINESNGLAMLWPLSTRPSTPANGITETGWLIFDNNPGIERVWIVWSAQPLPALEAAVGEAVQPSRMGRIPDAYAGPVRRILQGLQSTEVIAENGEVVLRSGQSVLGAGFDLRHR